MSEKELYTLDEALAMFGLDRAELEAEDLRERFNHACDQFDLINDGEGPMRCGISMEEHSRAAMRRRREVDRLWREADKAGVDVSDIAKRWDIGPLNPRP